MIAACSRARPLRPSPGPRRLLTGQSNPPESSFSPPRLGSRGVKRAALPAIDRPRSGYAAALLRVRLHRNRCKQRLIRQRVRVGVPMNTVASYHSRIPKPASEHARSTDSRVNLRLISVRVLESCFPMGTGRSRAAGQCWSPVAESSSRVTSLLIELREVPATRRPPWPSVAGTSARAAWTESALACTPLNPISSGLARALGASQSAVK
jgi:hypothetical protein